MPSPLIPLNTQQTEMFQINLTALKKFLFYIKQAMLALTAGFGNNDKFDLNLM